jgi:cellulose 1,4-beta-cellobiosidase
MRYSLNFVALAAFAATNTYAAPSQLQKVKARQAQGCASAVTIAPGSNIFSGRTLHANSLYAAEIAAAQEGVTDATLKAKMGEVAKVGTFLWM